MAGKYKLFIDIELTMKLRFFNVFIRKVKFLLGDDFRKIPLMVCLFIFISLIDIAGIGLIAPYITLIVSPDRIIESDLYNLLLKFGLTRDMDELLIILSLFLFTVFVFKSIFGVLVNRVILLYCINHGVHLRSYLMESYQNIKYEEYIQRNSSEYIYHIQELSAKFSHTTLQAILRVISEGLVFITIILFLSWVNFFAVLVLAGIITISIFSYDFLFKKKLNVYGKKVNKHSKKMIQGVSEGIEGFKEIRVLGKEEYFHNIVKTNATVYSQTNVKSLVISSIPKYFMELLMVTFIVAIVLASLFSGQELKSLLPTLSIFGVAAIRLVPSSNQIMSSIVQIRFGKDAINSLYNDIKKFNEKPNLKSKTHPLTGLKEEKFRSLNLDDVSYRYPGAEHDSIINVSLTIEAGESIGIIGPSGSGKTTIVDIMLGLLEPTKGSVAVNGEKIEEGKHRWKNYVAYLPQQTFLIDNSVRNNIALGVLDCEIENEKIVRSLDQVKLAGVISKLPDGLNTMLGERGVRLSGGQRQRIALARAFYHDRDVLIMDESTSALDNQTESEIVNQIKRFKEEKTMIVIAHRLTTLMHCDRIYKLNNGRLLSVGSYKSLIENANK